MDTGFIISAYAISGTFILTGIHQLMTRRINKVKFLTSYKIENKYKKQNESNGYKKDKKGGIF